VENKDAIEFGAIVAKALDTGWKGCVSWVFLASREPAFSKALFSAPQAFPAFFCLFVFK
jgi:hypothetical protein